MNIEERKAKKRNKKRNRLIFRTIILAILLVAVIFALVSNLSKDKAIIGVGDDAENFQLKQVNKNAENFGEAFMLSDLEGKGIMLNFWATYCKPCEKEMPYMEELYPTYKEKGVEIVTVNLDISELVIDRFIDKYDLTFPVLHDTKSEIMDLYSVGPIPSTFFISPEGKVVEKIEGALTLERLDGYLQQIVPN